MKIRELKTSEKTAKPVVAFIQFMSMNGVTKFQKAMDVGFFSRAFLTCVCRKDKIRHKYLDGKIWPTLLPAPEPTLIMWNNLGIGRYQRMIRIFVINVISILVMIVGFAGITYGRMLARGQ
jgi:hypothetical protein